MTKQITLDNTNIDSIEKVRVVIEGEFERALLAGVLNDDYGVVIDIIAGSSYSSALSITRTIHIKYPNSKVVLLVNANTSIDHVIEERMRYIESYMRGRIADKDRFKLVLFAPQIERIFFESKDILSSFIGKELNDLELEIGRLTPTKTLKKYGFENIEDKIKLLTPEVIHLIKQQAVFKEIKDFINT